MACGSKTRMPIIRAQIIAIAQTCQTVTNKHPMVLIQHIIPLSPIQKGSKRGAAHIFTPSQYCSVRLSLLKLALQRRITSGRAGVFNGRISSSIWLLNEHDCGHCVLDILPSCGPGDPKKTVERPWGSNLCLFQKALKPLYHFFHKHFLSLVSPGQSGDECLVIYDLFMLHHHNLKLKFKKYCKCDLGLLLLAFGPLVFGPGGPFGWKQALQLRSCPSLASTQKQRRTAALSKPQVAP